MNEFEVVTVIGRPAEEVFAVVQDVAKSPLWTPGLLEVRRTSEGPLGVGATMVYVGTFLGRRFESPVACTAFAENKQLATATTRGAVLSRGRPDARASGRGHQADVPLLGG
jgi:ribosome-associated toxin RatA of RatAB toxin-antitoxin module